MKNIYLKLMNEFKGIGLSCKKSISPFMAAHFNKPTYIRKPDWDMSTEWEKQNSDADLFIQDVKDTGHFIFYPREDDSIGFSSTKGVYKWYDEVNINAKLTINGLEYLEKHQANKRVIANSNTQTLAILLTVLLTGITLTVTLHNATSDKQLDKLQTHIRAQTQQLHTLQIQLSQSTTELLLEKKANKDLRKKP